MDGRAIIPDEVLLSKEVTRRGVIEDQICETLAQSIRDRVEAEERMIFGLPPLIRPTSI
jgi:hypothetical protein